MEELKYEIVSTMLGDSGCSSVNPTYNKRKRFPRGAVPLDCRQPRGMGAIEKAMRNSKNRTTTHIFEPVLGMVFDSREEAYQFITCFHGRLALGYATAPALIIGLISTGPCRSLFVRKRIFDPRCTSSSKRSRCKAMIRLHHSQGHG